MKKLNPLYFTKREDWRGWLEKNFNKEKEVWLLFPHKSSGRPRISYNDAVEEALCFGWIDSTVKNVDEENSMQRFSPRNLKSKYSQANKERLRWLLQKKKVHPSMRDTARKVLEKKFVFPQDIMDSIKSDKIAWKNYQQFSPSYKRIRIAYIETARKRPEEFMKRLNNFIRKTRENKLIGFGGIEKHY